MELFSYFQKIAFFDIKTQNNYIKVHIARNRIEYRV